MVSVGIDVSKGKSTVCLMRPFGEIVAGPMEISHVDSELKTLVKLMKSLNDEVKVVMEATGIYHLPVLTYLKENGIFTAVINPYQMKQYRVQGLRRVKTDKADSMTIAKYGLDNWDELKDFVSSEDKYRELTLLSRQYRHYMRIHVASLQELTHILDYTMPGVKKEFDSWNPENGKTSSQTLSRNTGITTIYERNLSGNLWKVILHGQRKRDTAVTRIKPLRSIRWLKKASLHYQQIKPPKCW